MDNEIQKYEKKLSILNKFIDELKAKNYE